MNPATLEKIAKQTGIELVSGSESTTVTGLCDDSRLAKPGDLFFCVSGSKHDGTRFAKDAVARGAVAVVSDRSEAIELGVPVLRTIDTRATLARAVRLLHRETLDRLRYVGVTGTNGKTTTTHLIASVLREAGSRTAIVGTLGTIKDDGSRVPSKNTTPGPLDLLRTISGLASEGYKTLVMEVSSQAVVQRRAAFLPFSSAVWTNLSPEHFELHGDIDTYRSIKVSFIEECDRLAREEGRTTHSSILNLKDPSSPRFLAACRGRVHGFCLQNKPTTPFQGTLVLGEEPSCDLSGGRMVISYEGRKIPVHVRLGGHFNLENALAAASVGLSWGVDPAAIVSGLALVDKVPGRFQRIPSDKRRVLIDYAHTSEGLENLLVACRKMVRAEERLIVVFGCGGDRDNTKRPRMGRTASQYADLCIVTNDNPRTEDPVRITTQILEGMTPEDRSKCLVEHDRRKAIGQALFEARPTDLVVVAGKGHEDYQLVGDQVLHFDDSEVVKETLARL